MDVFGEEELLAQVVPGVVVGRQVGEELAEGNERVGVDVGELGRGAEVEAEELLQRLQVFL